MHPAHLTNKVGLVPYAFDASGERLFLIHLPIAKNPSEQDEMIWGLVRGTVRDVADNDLRSLDALRATPPEQIEAAKATAIAEAEEECGLTKEYFDFETIRDHGLLNYHSLTKPPYPIQFFSAALPSIDIALLKARATDAANLAFHPLPNLRVMAESGQFKPGYIAILEQIDADLSTSS